MQYYHIDDFKFQDGSPPSAVKLAYLDLNPTALKTALAITCFRGRLASTLTFAHGALQDHRIVVVALFGNGESSSPSNMSTPPRSFDYRDCLRAQNALLTQHLGIHEIDVVVGFSMGGQCAYYWTLMYPNMIRNAVIICSSARTSRHNYQFLEGPKAALEYSEDYQARQHVRALSSDSSHPSSVRGALRAFGKAYSAWLTSPAWFEEEMYKSLGYKTLSAWDEVVAGASYYSWDPDDLLAKLSMWQRGDVTSVLEMESGTTSATLSDALSKIRARVLLMPSRSDQYFRWEASEKEARCIPNVTLRVIDSEWGHLAGIGVNQVDKDWMDWEIARFLSI
ncbi:Alpha/Beta hydrolase protein [Aspergillus pseudoustus]|uniref:Alpha/Beta hydrolase protein n=1 Tax=Aspergillus pseudoustus TaxID=1810923 RepID=A0ABR4L2S4_9EURO